MHTLCACVRVFVACCGLVHITRIYILRGYFIGTEEIVRYKR